MNRGLEKSGVSTRNVPEVSSKHVDVIFDFPLFHIDFTSSLDGAHRSNSILGPQHYSLHFLVLPFWI